MPYYIKAELGRVAYTYYSQLDSLGRAGIAVGCLGPETLPTTDRKDPSYDPTGWIQASYSGSVVTGGQIWNRSHLIAWSLGSDSSKLNLVTGTPYFNQIGMVKFENMVRDYIKETGNHVLYRVVPVFVGDELVCRGVTIEAFSIEDNGGRDTSDESDGICFNVFIHNVNPGINIDYATGKTSLVPGYEPEEPDVENYVFVLNTSSKKIHMPDCSSVTTMSDKNKGYTDKTYEELVAEGYAGCKICHPENHQP